MLTPLSIPDSVIVRPAVMGDLPFIDSLQKMHTKMVGWMPTKQFEGKINAGHVIVAEEAGAAVGYCIGHDQYFKRDDVGIIYQMNVIPGRQRGLVGATLLKAQFEKSAWGCKLYCCWCAQDIGANRFWEAMGFVPLAFRAGSAEKSRTHIFWQRRIRQGDVTTPWWFPSQTSAGSIREDRLVLPIPPGMHWSDAKPMVLPGAQPVIEDQTEKRAVKAVKKVPSKEMASLSSTALRFGAADGDSVKAVVRKAKTPRVARKNDPQLVAAARELRDRWLEEVNAGRYLPGQTTTVPSGKYDIGRAMLTGNAVERSPLSAVPMKQIAA